MLHTTLGTDAEGAAHGQGHDFDADVMKSGSNNRIRGTPVVLLKTMINTFGDMRGKRSRKRYGSRGVQEQETLKVSLILNATSGEHGVN